MLTPLGVQKICHPAISKVGSTASWLDANFLSRKIDISIKERDEHMTQEELRNLYKQRLEKEKQSYISKQVKIDPSILSKFKTGKINLYPELFIRLETYISG